VGEMSGHIFFNYRWTGYDDALYVAVRALAVLGQTGESLADFRRRLPSVVSTPELRIPCADNRKALVVRVIARRLKETGTEMDDADGIGVRDGGGWWLLRASNTQAVLAGRCESADAEDLSRIRGRLAGLLAEHGLELPKL